MPDRDGDCGTAPIIETAAATTTAHKNGTAHMVFTAMTRISTCTLGGVASFPLNFICPHPVDSSRIRH